MAEPLLTDPLPRRFRRRRWGLLALGAALGIIYLGVLVLSGPFAGEAPGRPILEVVGLLTAATVCYLAALALVFAKETATDRWTLPIVLAFSLLFRLLLLPSMPILEIDFYRYLWDGRVALHGFNPYRYSPFQIEDADSQEQAPQDLAALSRLSRQSEAVQEIFGRVHYRDVPTVYPPGAQGVFAGAVWLTPADAPAAIHIFILKAILVVFDLATLVVLAALLRLLQLPPVWCLAYGWCPLVLKEIANSGHLDSIAVFFTVLAVFLLIAAIGRARGVSPPREESVAGTFLGGLTAPARRADGLGRQLLLATAAAASLALGVLAKTYPLLLVPVVGAFLLARLHRRAAFPLAVFAGTILAGYLPFCEPARQRPATDLATPHHPASGLAAFLSQWETNDCLFMVVYYNVRRPEDVPRHWFVQVPETWRTALHDGVLDPLREAVALSPRVNPAFLLSQSLVGLVLLGCCLHWARQVYREPRPEVLLRCVFRTLVWGWLLSSAANPWYLLWCLPFMVFDGRLSWFLLPGAALLYYVRFWIEERAGTADMFDFGLIWLEYLPFMVLLAAESWRRSKAVVGPLSGSVAFAEPGAPLGPIPFNEA